MRISLQFFSFILITLNYTNELLLFSGLLDNDRLRFSSSVNLTCKGVAVSVLLHSFYIIIYLGLFIFFRLPRNNFIVTFKRGVPINFLFLFFAVVALLKLNSILSMGLADFLMQARGNEGGIGGLTYIVLIGWPILMLVYETSLLEKIFSWTVLIILNLMTGFRIILLMSLLLHFVHLLRKRNYDLNFKAVLLFVFLILTSYVFSIARVESSLMDESYFVSFLNSLNRSNSVLTVAYAHDQAFLFPMKGFLELSLQPLQAFIGYFVGLIGLPSGPSDYEIKVFSEFFYKNYLYLRGTGLYDASGFSNTILMVLYSFFGWGCLIVIPVFLFIISYFTFFYQVKNIYNHTSISLLYTFFLVSSIESYSVGLGYLFYGLFFVLVLRLLRSFHEDFILRRRA